MPSAAISSSIPFPTAARVSPCKPSASATEARRCAAGPGSSAGDRNTPDARRRAGRGPAARRRRAGGAAGLPRRVPEGRRGQGPARSRRGRGPHRRPHRTRVRGDAHHGCALDPAQDDSAAARRDPEEPAGRLLLSLSARAVPWGQRYRVREGLPEPPCPRRGPARLDRQGLSDRTRSGADAPVIGAAELARAARAAFAYAQAQPGVREVEVFVAANASLLTRLCYTSHIPCNGVEEPKSTESRGIGIQAVFESPEGPLLGFGSEPADLGERGAERALAKARAAAVRDPEFVSLPRPRPEPRTLFDYDDSRLMSLDDASLVEAGWKIVGGGLRAFTASSRLAELAGGDQGLRALGLILGGDVTVLLER